MECIYCKKSKISFVDKYKIEINKDVKYLGEMSIFKCNDCEIAFCNPMPNSKVLEYFYAKIYRTKNRPHYYDEYYKKYSFIDNINLDYLSYLTTFIDFSKINSIFDFGAGLGNLGYIIKKQFNHINLYSCENDENCLHVLKERGYKNFSKLEEVNIKFDLVISLHCLEHLSNLEPLHKLQTLINHKGYLFIEVPNGDFEKGYINRIFDSPHLLFFNKKSLENIFKNMSLNIVNLIYSSYSIEHDIENQKARKFVFSKQTFTNKIKKIIKNLLPYFTRIYFILNERDKMKWHTHGRENSRCIRGLLIKDN